MCDVNVQPPLGKFFDRAGLIIGVRLRRPPVVLTMKENEKEKAEQKSKVEV